MLAQSQVFATSQGSIEILMPKDFHETVQLDYETVDSTVTVDGKTYAVDAFANPFDTARRIYRLKVSTETKPARHFIVCYAFFHGAYSGVGTCGFVSENGSYPNRHKVNEIANGEKLNDFRTNVTNVMEVSASDYRDFFGLSHE